MGNYYDTFKEAGFGDIMDTKRFVMFKIVERDGKKTKVPFQTNGKPAKSTDSTTWSTFKECEELLLNDIFNYTHTYDGMGIILGDYYGTKIVGIDLDHCINPMSGEWENEEARKAVSNLHSYAETSISGSGYHCLMKNVSVPEGFMTRSNADSKFDLEVYESGRYFTLSFNRLNSEPVSQDQDGLNELVNTYLPRRVNSVKTMKPVFTSVAHPKNNTPMEVTTDMNPLVQAEITNNIVFRKLWNGERSGNESRDDFALMSGLVRILHTRDKEVILNEFRKSKFYQTKDSSHLYKIDERADYVDRTLMNAATGIYFPYSLDDVGNSDMFCELYANQLKFVPEWNDWVWWNGKYFEKRADLRSKQLAKDMIKNFRENLKRVDSYSSNMSSDDVERVKIIKKHAAGMGYANRISAMLSLAQSGLAVSADEFDKEPFGVNCPNGYYNLKENSFYPSDSKYMCTNITGYDYQPEGDCPEFKAFLKKIIPDDNIREFFGQCVGMAMVGKVYEEVMVFLVGDGCNGKSTLANILSQVMGTYTTSLQPDVITSMTGSKTPPDIAEVRGRRIVFISETEEGDTLSTKALKRLCSNERLAVRRLYCMPESFVPSHTIFYSTNHKPRVSSNDNGTWRRIKIIPFTYQFKEEEKITNFAEKLLEKEGGAILHWCIEQAQKFIANGLKLIAPEEVKAETNEYKQSEDVMAQFVDEMIVIKYPETCIADPIDSRRIKSSVLYTVYKNWCKINNYPAKNVSVFTAEFTKKTNSEKKNISGVKYWYNVALAN